MSVHAVDLRHQESSSAFGAFVASTASARMQLAVATACFAVLLHLGWQRLMYPQLWAEDGQLFIAEALQFGWGAVTLPYGGYFHLAPRLITGLVLLMPIRYAATIIFLSCSIIYAFVASTFSRPEYRWLVPSDALRALLCPVLCVTPGLYEVVGNLANLHTVLFIYVAILAWKEYRSTYSSWQLVVSFLACGSDAGTLVMLPAFLLRMYLQVRNRLTRAWLSSAALCCIIVVWFVVHRRANNVTFTEWAHLGEWLPGGSKIFMERFFIFPVLGADITRSFVHTRPWVTWVIGPILGLLNVRLLWARFHGISFFWVLGVPFCTFALAIATWIGRPGAFQWMLERSIEGRYAGAGGPIALVLWATALQSLGGRAYQSVRAIFLVAAMIMGWRHGKLGVYPGKAEPWPKACAPLENALRRAVCEEIIVPTNPDGWQITYQVSKPE